MSCSMHLTFFVYCSLIVFREDIYKHLMPWECESCGYRPKRYSHLERHKNNKNPCLRGNIVLLCDEFHEAVRELKESKTYNQVKSSTEKCLKYWSESYLPCVQKPPPL